MLSFCVFQLELSDSYTMLLDVASIVRLFGNMRQCLSLETASVEAATVPLEEVVFHSLARNFELS